MVSECVTSFENNHFHGELFHLFSSTGIIIANLRFSTMLNMNFFVSPHILTIFWGLFTDHSSDHVTVTSHSNWRSLSQ